MLWIKGDLGTRKLRSRDSLDAVRNDARGGSDYIELLILLGTVAFAALIGITLFGDSVSKLFDKEADHVATMTAWVPGTQPSPGSGSPLSSAGAAVGQSAAPGGGASSGGSAANGSSAISGGSKASLPVVIANSNTAANGSQTPGAQPLVNNLSTKASGARPFFTARSGNAGSIAIPPASIPTLGEAAAALAEAIGKHPVAAVVVPVLTNPAADGTLDGNPDAKPIGLIPDEPFPSDYPSSSAPAPTAEEVNSIPPSTAQEPSTDSTPPFPADDPTSDSTPPFPQAEETGNTTPPSPGAEPGIDPADPNTPVGNSNSDGTPTEGAIPITPSAPDEEPPNRDPDEDESGERPESPANKDPSGPLLEDPADDVDVPASTVTDVACDPATDPDSCGLTVEDGFPDDPAENASTADNASNAESTNDTASDDAPDTIACDPDTDPDSCGLTADEGFPDEAEDSGPKPGDANDIAGAAFVVGSEILQGDAYGAGGALVGVVINFNADASLAGGAATGAQVGSLIGILISGDEQALRDWAAAQATNYVVGQVVGAQNAGFVIGFVTNIADGNYAGAAGLYLGTIACGPICGAIGDFVFTAVYGNHKKREAKRELETDIWGYLGEAIASAEGGVADAVQLAAENGLCSTVPPIHIPAPDGDPQQCTQNYFDGIAKLDAITACGNHFEVDISRRPGRRTIGTATIQSDPQCTPRRNRPCLKVVLSIDDLVSGSYDHLMQCEEPNLGNSQKKVREAWEHMTYNSCLSQRPGDPALHSQEWFVERQVREIASDIVEGNPGANERLEQLLRGAAAAAWERTYNEAVAKYCPQGADTPGVAP